MPPEAKCPYWRVRYRDPDTSKIMKVRVPSHLVHDAELRRGHAVELAKKLNGRRDELRGGASKHTEADTKLEPAFKIYFDGLAKRKRAGTQRNYRATCDRFLAWCALPTVQLRTVRQLSRGALARWAAARGAESVKASTVNRDLKNLSAVLNKLRKLEVVRMTTEDISDGLDLLDTETERREFLRASDLGTLVAACRKYDAANPGKPSSLGLVLFLLLSGMRVAEALGLEWRDVSDTEINVRSLVSKTNSGRGVGLACSPLLAALVSERANHRPHDLVLGDWSKADIHILRKVLAAEHGAPRFTSQALRCTCGTFLTCAPGIYGGASAYMSAKRLGHSVTIAEKHYTGVIEVDRDARTLDAVMQLDVTLASCPRL